MKEFLSTILNDCTSCPETAEGCETYRPLYMVDYNNCMKDCGKYITFCTIETDAIARELCMRHLLENDYKSE